VKYPSVSLDDLEHVSGQLLQDASTNIESSIRWVGDGDEIDLTAITALGRTIAVELAQLDPQPPTVGDEAEGKHAGDVHAALVDIPLRILDDPGFWRYLGATHLWSFTVARQRSTFETGDWMKYRKYVDGRTRAECVPLRMFIRGQIALRGLDYSLASAVSAATDLWRSHIVRIRTSYSPVLAQGLIRQQVPTKMSTDDLREHAKRITRVASNVLLHLYDEKEVDTLLAELDPRPPATPTSSVGPTP
jgi:hypothetical protein